MSQHTCSQNKILRLPQVIERMASSKTLAKLANHLAKKKLEFSGVCDLLALSEFEISAYFSELDVGEVWGVGRRISERLRQMGFPTVQALRDASPKHINSRNW